MKKLILAISYVFGLDASAQTVVMYDYMETWNWTGLWNIGVNANWYTNASVSPTESAVLFGVGNGTSAIEADWYVLPNVTGLNASSQYQLKFRLASYTFSAPTAATRGVDAADYVSVQVSTNGGAYVNELRIAGSSNATWPYTASGSVTHIANGSFTNSAAPVGDVYTSTTANGISTVTLNLLPNTNQVAVDIYCRANSAGEEWWIDNIELIEIPEIDLPVELISFEGFNQGGTNLLKWKTGSEYNSGYFYLDRSVDGDVWEEIAVVGAAGNSTEELEYQFRDVDFEDGINYYRLTQVDIDGTEEWFDNVIAIDNTSDEQVVRRFNFLGQEVSDDYSGIYIEILDDGSVKKVIYEIK
jgi:hypothetical protein